MFVKSLPNIAMHHIKICQFDTLQDLQATGPRLYRTYRLQDLHSTGPTGYRTYRLQDLQATGPTLYRTYTLQDLQAKVDNLPNK